MPTLWRRMARCAGCPAYAEAMEHSVTLLGAYNSWAMARTLVSLDQLSFEDYTATGCSGHGSIRDTLIHAMDAERGWVRWLDGSMSAREAWRDRLEVADHPTLADAKRLWTEVDAKTRALIGSLDDASLEATWSIPGRDGSETRLAARDVLLHVLNHGTHTRAQISAAIRRHGGVPQPTDLMRFLVER